MVSDLGNMFLILAFSGNRGTFCWDKSHVLEAFLALNKTLKRSYKFNEGFLELKHPCVKFWSIWSILKNSHGFFLWKFWKWLISCNILKTYLQHFMVIFEEKSDKIDISRIFNYTQHLENIPLLNFAKEK